MLPVLASSGKGEAENFQCLVEEDGILGSGKSPDKASKEKPNISDMPSTHVYLLFAQHSKQINSIS
jgi:hypothetical protein